jgi:hypothetical protein
LDWGGVITSCIAIGVIQTSCSHKKYTIEDLEKYLVEHKSVLPNVIPDDWSEPTSPTMIEYFNKHLTLQNIMNAEIADLIYNLSKSQSDGTSIIFNFFKVEEKSNGNLKLFLTYTISGETEHLEMNGKTEIIAEFARFEAPDLYSEHLEYSINGEKEIYDGKYSLSAVCNNTDYGMLGFVKLILEDAVGANSGNEI